MSLDALNDEQRQQVANILDARIGDLEDEADLSYMTEATRAACLLEAQQLSAILQILVGPRWPSESTPMRGHAS